MLIAKYNAIFELNTNIVTCDMRAIHFVLLIQALLLTASCSDNKKVKGAGTLRVATAANMQFAMDSIGQAFEKKHGIHVDVTSNSSGMLTAQIEKGAPFDVFVSANMRYPEKLKRSGFGETPEVYAYGRLILVFNEENRFTSIEDCFASGLVKRIAVADPGTAPYGIAAMEFLEKTGLKSKYTDKIVLGESVGQVNQYVTTGAVDAAFTSYSFLTRFEANYSFIEVDPEMFSEIEQGMLILKHGREENAEASEKFLEYLRSDECKEILKHFGYRVN